jgi:hypothetical protein
MTKYLRPLAIYYSLTTINYLRPSTSVEKALQISSFMPNKPNSPNVQMNLTRFIAINYAILTSLTKVKYKPNTNPIQTQTKPILAHYKGYQSQFKANSNPIFNPRCLLTCFSVGGKANLSSVFSLLFSVFCFRLKSKFFKIYLTKMFDSWLQFCKITIFV